MFKYSWNNFLHGFVDNCVSLILLKNYDLDEDEKKAEQSKEASTTQDEATTSEAADAETTTPSDSSSKENEVLLVQVCQHY